MSLVAPPAGYVALNEACVELMRRMYELVPTSDLATMREVEWYDGLGRQRRIAAAEIFRQPILSAAVGLYALLNSKEEPIKLDPRRIADLALFPANGRVLTFFGIDRRLKPTRAHPNIEGLTSSQIRELEFDPLYVLEEEFREWLNARFARSDDLEAAAGVGAAKHFTKVSELGAHPAVPEIEISKWYGERVRSWPCGEKQPSRDDDIAAAKEHFSPRHVPGTRVRTVRRRLAPSSWTNPGRRGT